MARKSSLPKDIGRFILGLVSGVLLFILSIITMFALYPVIIGGSLIFSILVFFIAVIFGIIGFVTMIWYLTRKEPNLEKDTNYSLKQGKEIE